MNITKTMLIKLAGEAVYQRGLAVYKNGAVLSIKEKAGYIFANVEGTETYQVKLQITDKVLDGSCDCPASDNFDFCKHCVATALAYQDRQEEQSDLQGSDPFDRIKTYINQLPEQEAKDALIQLIIDDDLLTNKWQLKADNASGSIDIKQLKKQITKALPYCSLWEYAKVRAYFTNAEAILDPIFDIFPQLNVEDVFSLTQYMLQRLNKLLEQLDDSGGYRFGLESQINNSLTQTFKQLPWPANKKSQFLLQAVINQDEYMVYPEVPNDFLDGSTQEINKLFYQAVKDKWDALPNLHNDASYKEKRPYTTLLYILLHQPELKKDTAREIELKAKVAIKIHDFIELAELNLAQGFNAKNIEKAEYWLKKAQAHQNKFQHTVAIKRLEVLLYKAKQEPKKASDILWQIFTKTERFTDFQQLQDLSEELGLDKAVCLHKAEAVLIKNAANQQHSRWHMPSYNLLEFYLKSEQINKATAFAKINKVDANQLKQIARNIISQDTETAFQFYQRIIMLYPQETNNTAYHQTIDLLVELKKGLPTEHYWHNKFEILLGEIKQAYKPKRNLMKLLAQNFD